MEKKFLNDLITPEVFWVAPDATVQETIRVMREKDVSCILVLEDRKPVGIFTERNIVRYATEKGHDFNKIKIKELMSSPVLTGKSDLDVYDAYSLFSLHKIRHLVVVNNHGDAIGIVTQSNIIENLGYEYFIEMKKISRIMSKNLFIVSKDHSVAQVLSKMAKNAVSCAIVTENGFPVGILTERDMARFLVDNLPLDEMKVLDAMSKPLITISEGSAVLEAAKSMQQHGIRRLIVVNEDGHLCGLTTQTDIIKELEGKYIDTLKQIIKQQDMKLESISRDLVETTVYLENILHSSVDMGVIAVNLDFVIVYFNPAAESLLGVEAEKVIGTDIDNIVISESGKLIYKGNITKTFDTFKRESFVIEQKIKGNIRFIHSSVSGIWDRYQELFGFVIMMHDITERKRAEDELAHMATHDFLTGLPNRALLHNLINHEAAHILRDKKKFAVMFLDLDEFKTINDSLGHDVGDKLLQSVGGRLQKTLRKSDTVARMGGDEFIVLLPGFLESSEASLIAEKIVGAINLPFIVNGQELSITTSVGIAIFPDDCDNPNDLIKCADLAMYSAKNHGKNRFQRFLPEMR
ncbi:MAG: diguanylate cyclase [Proteobacteria bacterium]|nr:diguanylate cyclase [Pseudomonadota bacterium]MBU1710967.1 diguanylate cyclase [Pseudomonadota bacterium]